MGLVLSLLQSAGESSLSSGSLGEGGGGASPDRSISPPLANSTVIMADNRGVAPRGGGTQPRPPAVKKRRAPQPPGGLGASVSQTVPPSRGKSTNDLNKAANAGGGGGR